MSDRNKYRVTVFLVATIWFVNGLICKTLNLVPRHEQIVARILGTEHSRLLTILIGLSEVFMAIWVLARFQTKLNAISQMIVIATMNILEFILVPDLLLWGRLNSFFALLFILLIYYNEFVLHKKINSQKN